MKPSRKSPKAKSPKSDIIFHKSPPKTGEFFADSEDEEGGPSGQAVNYVHQMVLSGNLSLVRKNSSDEFVPPPMPAVISPLLFSSTRALFIRPNDSIPNLSCLKAVDSSTCLPNPFAISDSDSNPDLGGIKAPDPPANHRVRPFSAKPRVIRKYRLKTDQHANAKQASSDAQDKKSTEQGTSQSSDLVAIELEKFEAAPLEERLISFGEIKWFMPDDPPPKPRIVRDYPYTKLLPLPARRRLIGLIVEEDECEEENVASTSKVVPPTEMANQIDSKETNKPTPVILAPIVPTPLKAITNMPTPTKVPLSMLTPSKATANKVVPIKAISNVPILSVVTTNKVNVSQATTSKAPTNKPALNKPTKRGPNSQNK